jgi:hypothetical protein
MFHGVTLLARVTIRFSKLWFTHLNVEELPHSTSDKLHGLLADEHFSHRTAWGQAGFHGGGNVMPCFATWAAVDGGLVIGPELIICSYIIDKYWNRTGGTKTNSLNSETLSEPSPLCEHLPPLKSLLSL